MLLRPRLLVALPPAIIGLAFLPLYRFLNLSAFGRHVSLSSDLAADEGKHWAITPDVDAYAHKTLREEGVPGLSIAAVRLSDTGEVQTDWAAWGRMTEDADPTSVDTLFNIGSCSKAFLVAALGILMEDYALGRNVTALPHKVDRVDFETKIQDVFRADDPPLFADSWARSQASFRDVLLHMSGIGSQDFVYGDYESPVSILEHMEHLRPAYELRERFSYTNLFYTIGAHLISTYSAMPYEDFVTERIFLPLGMTSSTYSRAEAMSTGRLSQSWTASGRRLPLWLGNNASKAWDGPAGIVSNVIDMSKWIATLLNEGVDPETNLTVIPRSIYEEMTTAHAVVTGAPRYSYTAVKGYGMGWERTSFQGHDIISHTGRMPSHLSEVLFLPSARLGVVALSNADLPQEAYHKVAYRVIEDVLKLPRVVDSDIHRRENDTSTLDGSYEEITTVVLAASLTRYTGIYANAAYGNFTLCAPTTKTGYCDRVLADFAACDELGEHPGLYAAYPRFTSSHIRLTPDPTERPRRDVESLAPGEKLDAWDLEFIALFPDGYGKDTTPFVYRVEEGSTMDVQCVVRAGVVVGCGIVNVTGEEGRTLREGPLNEVADVWFQKIE
ncbi:beta-lactamase/transpeptidase-like protein [Fomitopsis serialis]|uniref:beta-lactamase/transpeptidase-like protein n=1 Tax=Fomitopsis serialis TaxID=139415 RepID=UPI00200805A1|nr:beta-lactamase/transpeptidase-like protein [Neoantrodia serialis]KAH9922373.1 beta-lactamase/transpeptidase-like protein [Neoantrodia serialis]